LKTLFAAVFAAAFLFQSAFAQIIKRPIAAPYIGLGAYSFNHADVFSFISNQGSLAQVKNIAAGVYAEKRFMLSELNYYTAVAALPVHSDNFGLKLEYSGFTEYNETQIGFAYARKLGDKIDVGVQFNYNGIRIAGYGNASAVSFEVGSIFHLTEKLHAGFHINNPVGGRFGKDQQEKLPSVYTAGFGYDASEKFFFSTEIIKEEDQPVNVNAGLQYKFIQQIWMRAGISSAVSTVWFGVGLQLQSFRIDVTGSYHAQLGMTPGLQLIFNLKANTN
jgi:hypothetical protein